MSQGVSSVSRVGKVTLAVTDERSCILACAGLSTHILGGIGAHEGTAQLHPVGNVFGVGFSPSEYMSDEGRAVLSKCCTVSGSCRATGGGVRPVLASWRGHKNRKSEGWEGEGVQTVPTKQNPLSGCVCLSAAPLEQTGKRPMAPEVS